MILVEKSDSYEILQRNAAFICTGAFRITSHEILLKELGWSKLENRRTLHRLTLFYKIIHSLTPVYLRQACTIIPQNTDNYQSRQNNSCLLPIIEKEIF